MNINEAFEKYPDNIFGLRVNKSTKIIDFWFNKDWEFPEKGKDEKVQHQFKKQKEDAGSGPNYYIIFSDNLTFEELYAEVSAIIDFNLEIEKKQKLFNQKVNDLKRLFVTMSYEQLKEIEFDTPLSLTKPQELQTEEVEHE
jgi:hypothetical protein